MKRRGYLIDDSICPVFVTTTVVQWIPVFGDKIIADETLRIFEQIRAELNVVIIAYVLMPSHFHAIAKTACKGDLSILMRKWKSVSAKAILQRCCE
jgi:REP element-mobilizing transposase RayT